MAELVLSPSTLWAGFVGFYYPVQFAASGGTPPYRWICSGLPPGIGMSPDGLLSGTVMQPVMQTILITAVDSGSPSVEGSLYLQLTIQQVEPGPCLVVSPFFASCTGDWSVPLSASGGQAPYRWSSPDCPYSLSPDGVLSGTGICPGDFSIYAADIQNRVGTINGKSISKQFTFGNGVIYTINIVSSD